MRALKLMAMPAAAFVLATLLDLPPLAAGVVVLFAAMPTGANVHLRGAVSAAGEPGVRRGGAGTLGAAATLPVAVVMVMVMVAGQDGVIQSTGWQMSLSESLWAHENELGRQ